MPSLIGNAIVGNLRTATGMIVISTVTVLHEESNAIIAYTKEQHQHDILKKDCK